jgi:peptide methionine sulfoxide reductase msrA/msrB
MSDGNRPEGSTDKKDVRARLTAEQYRVTQERGTEPPFENAYWNNHEPGIYLDIVSGALLFTSETKYDSGCGWPSFTEPAGEDSIIEVPDHSAGLSRTEIRGRDSGAHLGHVFPDGPAPRGLRYCVNSAALRFVPERECTAVLAAGCFWGSEAYFRRVPGVLSAVVGYTGGQTVEPRYEEVSSGVTGHAEAVRVLFDPERITYRAILRHFFRMHDPTTLNRQGPDVGSQYRSAIFYIGEFQKEVAGEEIRAIGVSGKRRTPVVTELVPCGVFWTAEEYHQRFLEKHPGGYCHVDPGLATEPLE